MILILDTNLQDYNQSLQSERRRRKLRLFLAVFIILAVGGGGIIYTVFFTNALRFDNIVLNGATAVTKEELFPGNKSPYFFAQVNITDPLVAKFTVHKNILQKILTIDIEERKPFGIWCSGSNTSFLISGASTTVKDVSNTQINTTSTPVYFPPDASTERCFWFDHDGLLFASAPATSGILVKSLDETNGRKLLAGDYILPEESRSRLFSIFNELDTAGIDIMKFILPDLKYQEIQAVRPSGTVFYFSLRFDPASTLEALQSLKPKLDGLKYVDFRSVNKVFYQ